jgi:hypothetical protein
LQPGLLLDQPLKSMRANSFQLIKFCCTGTDPAAKTESIGLQADARIVMVFASPSGQFKCNMTNPAYLSGPRHLDNFIVTKKSCSLTGTLQKHMPTLTLTATNQTAGPLALILDSNYDNLVTINNVVPREILIDP